MKLKPSSLFQPAINGTSLCWPAAKISAGGRGRNHPIDDRTEAESGRGGEDGVSRGRAQRSQGFGSDFAHEVDSDGLGFGERTPARASGEANNAPLSPMTRANNPLASGEAMSALAANEPADSPAIVTCPGSPPNAAMLRFTHPSAATRSRNP